MHIKKMAFPVIVLFAAIYSGTAMSAGSEVQTLAETYGCTSCHSLAAKTITKEKPALPVGPSFQQIAERFQRNQDEGKYQELYRVVKHGSSPYRSKWQGQISGLAMPPNDETISDLDINRLLVWILTSFDSNK